jgi:hypothetical protein
MKTRKSGLVLLGQIVGIMMGGPEMIKRYLKKKKRMLVDALVCISTPQDTVDSVGG